MDADGICVVPFILLFIIAFECFGHSGQTVGVIDLHATFMT